MTDLTTITVEEEFLINKEAIKNDKYKTTDSFNINYEHSVKVGSLNCFTHTLLGKPKIIDSDVFCFLIEWLEKFHCCISHPENK